MEFTWSSYQQAVADKESGSVTLTRMPAMLGILSGTIDFVRNIQPDHPKLQGVITTIVNAQNPLNAKDIFKLLKQFQTLRGTHKYIRKGEALMKAKQTEHLVDLSELFLSLI